MIKLWTGVICVLDIERQHLLTLMWDFLVSSEYMGPGCKRSLKKIKEWVALNVDTCTWKMSIYDFVHRPWQQLSTVIIMKRLLDFPLDNRDWKAHVKTHLRSDPFQTLKTFFITLCWYWDGWKLNWMERKCWVMRLHWLCRLGLKLLLTANNR